MKIKVISYGTDLKLECAFNKGVYVGSRACAKCNNYLYSGIENNVKFIDCTKPYELLNFLESVKLNTINE
jgi:hypothetical protein